MKRRFALVAALALLSGGPPWAGAAAKPATVCRFRAESSLVPGLGLTPRPGRFTTGDPVGVFESGVIDCRGPVAGHRPTGPGTIGFAGTYGPGGCLAGGRGAGRHVLTLPTADGPVRLTNDFTFRWGLAGGEPPFDGRFDGPLLSGRFRVRAIEGDCVTNPVTRVRLTATGVAPGR